MIAENALFHDIGRIFQPLFDAVGWVLALIYGIIPNYAIAIILLTVVIMVLLTPLTIKSTRSMLAMSELQPEIKKLQAKYKGAENRQKLNEELMALYKEKGINPAGGCLPMFLQMPFLIILYDTIRGLTNVVTVNGQQLVQPRYIPKPPHGATTHSLVENLYHSLTAHNPLVTGHGIMVSFGVDLANKPFGSGLSGTQRIPYFAMVVLAVGLQYFQMRQMNQRNKQAAANKQMQTIQKITPILFAYIYFIIPAGVVVYMIVSTLIRILTQEVMFRTGMVQMPGAERTIGGAKRRFGRLAGAPSLVAGEKPELGSGSEENGSGTTTRPAAPRTGTANGKPRGSTNGATKKIAPAHPRARSKRPRKAR